MMLVHPAASKSLPATGPPEQRLVVPGRGLLCHDCVSAIRAAIVNQGGDSDSG
jgi:hypothetical protein